MTSEKTKSLTKWLCFLGLLLLTAGVAWKLAREQVAVIPSGADKQTESLTAESPEPAPTAPSVRSSQGARLAEVLGIQIAALHLGAGGSRVGVQFRVLDPQRATLLTNALYKVHLIDSRGQKLALPHTRDGAYLQRGTGHRLTAGRIYSHFLPNPGGIVKSGDKVTFVIGSLRMDNLVVQ